MALKIVIPERTHQELGHSISKLLPIVGAITSTAEVEIELDFSKAKMLNPFFLGGIASVIDYARLKGKNIKLNHNENYRISLYLERICFPFCYSPEKENEQTFFQKLEAYDGKTYIPILAFPTGFDNYHGSVREKMLSAISALLKNQLNFKERERQPLSRKMLVHGLRGKFFIWTGRTAFIETIEREDLVQFPTDFNFQGTFIALRIPTIISDSFNFYDFIE